MESVDLQIEEKPNYQELQKYISDLEEALLEQNQIKKELTEFRNIGMALSSERDADKILPVIMKSVSTALNADLSTIFLISWEHMNMRLGYAEGLGNQQIYLDSKIGIAGSCALNRKLFNIPNAYENPLFNPEYDRISGFRTESVLAVPLINQQEVLIGVMQLINKHSGVFTEQDSLRAMEVVPEFSEIDYAYDEGLEKAKALASKLKNEIKCDRCTIFLLNEENGVLSSICTDEFVEGIKLNLNLGIAGLSAITGQEIIVSDAYSDPRFDRSTDDKTGYRTKNIICIPINNRFRDRIGVIEVLNKKDGDFSDSDLNLLKTLSIPIALFIENSNLINEYQQQFKSVLEVMAASIDAKDSLTAGHSKSVEKYSCGIARKLGFEESEIDIISVAAMLHDYGKIGTDEKILKKPGKLTPEEFDHIKEHAVNTRRLLDKMNFVRKYRDVPNIASSHHEKLDGSGYMRGIKKSEIPFKAKIIAVADVYDALTAKRHYRDALSQEKAFEIMDEMVDSHLDGNIVAALKEYLGGG